MLLGAVLTQSESADAGITSDKTIEDISAYTYLDYGSFRVEHGLEAYYSDPATRQLVVSFLEEWIGDPQVADALIAAAEKNNLDPALVVAVAWKESGFCREAYGVNTNDTVDRGLMQLNSRTFRNLNEEDFYNPSLNADLGASYLKSLLDKAGNTATALAMYNAGPGRVSAIGAPKSTLEYIDSILNYKTEISRIFYENKLSGGILVSKSVKPVKNPDLL